MGSRSVKYKHISEKPYCCIPATVQMILRRRKLSTPTQSDIGYNLGMILPPHRRNSLGVKSHSGSRPKAGWGTRINLKKYSLGQFFKKRRLPLTEKYYPAAHFKSSKQLGEFIDKNLKAGSDILACFNYPLLYGKDGAWGHASLIQTVSSKQVTLVDPGKKYKVPRKVSLGDLLKAMKKHFGGGMWVVQPLRDSK